MRPLALMFLFAVAAAAQVTDGIVASVNRTVTITPDEADFTVVVGTTLDTTQQQMIQAFQNAGVQNLNVISVAAGRNGSAYPPPAESQLFYQVTFTTTPSAMKSYAKLLDQMRAKLPDGFVSLQFAATQTVSQAAVDAAHQNVLPQLLADARTRAQALATAAGLKLGAIQGVAESSYSTPGAVAIPTIITGSFVSSSLTSGSGTQYSFFASVKFAAQ